MEFLFGMARNERLVEEIAGELTRISHTATQRTVGRY
jgi:hypothetical protein